MKKAPLKLTDLPMRPEDHVKRVIESTNLAAKGDDTPAIQPPESPVMQAPESPVATAPASPVAEPPAPPVAEPPESPAKAKRVSEPSPKVRGTRLSVDLDPEFHKQLRKRAIDEGLKLTDLLRNLLEDYLNAPAPQQR